MQDIKQNLADAVREARTKLGLSQEQLAEILGFDSRTILNIENGRGNPKFENLCALIRYLNLTENKIFYPDRKEPRPNHERLLALLDDCTEQEAEELIPAIRYLLTLMRHQNNPPFQKNQSNPCKDIGFPSLILLKAESIIVCVYIFTDSAFTTASSI